MSTTTIADLYPTRTVAQATITARRDPVVHGDGEGPLGAASLTAFEEKGYLVVPGLLPAGVIDELNVQIDGLAADAGVKGRAQAIVEPESDALRSLFEVHKEGGPLGALAGDPRLAGVACQLLGGDVYLHQSRINLKPGFRGREFYWHSDFETWHAEDGLPRMRTVSASVLLTPNHSWNGPLLVMAGSHRWFVSCVGPTPEDHYRQSLRRQEIGTPDEDSLRELARRAPIEQCTGPAGSVVFFDCNAMHGSNGNITPLPRRNVFLVYNSVDNTPVEPFAAPSRRPSYIAAREFDPVGG